MDVDGDSHKSLTVVTAITTFFTLFHMKNSTSTSEDVRHVSVYLKAWNIEYDDVLWGIPLTVRKDRSPTPYKAGRWRGFIGSRVKTRSQCQPTTDQRDSKAGKGEGGKRKTEVQVEVSKSGTPRQYCTLQYLRGLVRRCPLDRKCPSVGEHGDGKHTISRPTFLRLLRGQLASNLDIDCERLYIQGWCSALFKVTLASYGYTVVAKGTIDRLVHHLRHEAAIHSKFRSL
jgi:hypothetical protein